MNAKHIMIAAVLFFIGNILIWYQANAQFVWPWWKGRVVLSVLGLGVPAGFFFYYGWTFAVREFESLWSARLFAYALSYAAFPILTYFYMDESPFKTKTIICVLLSLAIIAVQILL
jgi:hypothetical protein